MRNIYSGILKMNERFGKKLSKCRVKYLLDEDYSKLLETYSLLSVAGEGTDYERAKRLLKWESDHIKHNGNYDNHVNNVALDLFEYAFDKEEGINCRSLSLALVECFLAIGMKARAVYMYPCSPYECDNHVVCEVWMREMKKWVMFDPTYNCIVFNEENIPLDVMEVRKGLANMSNLHMEPGFNYNGEFISENKILEYYAKDMFWFSVCSVQGTNGENKFGVRRIAVAPKNYSVHKYQRCNKEFRKNLR